MAEIDAQRRLDLDPSPTRQARRRRALGLKREFGPMARGSGSVTSNRLFFHPASSASMRVTPYLACRGVPASFPQPCQNIPFIIQAMGEWGMVKAPPTQHPLRVHFIRREFCAIERILNECAGRFAVGDDISLADCFGVPQVRNALLAGIELGVEFPTLYRVFQSMLVVPKARAVVEEAGGVVQPVAFDAERFEVCARRHAAERECG